MIYVFHLNHVTDVIIKDRQNEYINNNLSIYESNCKYIGYIEEEKKSDCECKIKSEMNLFNIKIDKDQLYNNNFCGESRSNINIIYC